MDDILEAKNEIRKEVSKKISELSKNELMEKTSRVGKRLFEFANFLESNIALLYINKPNEVTTEDIIQQCYRFNKIVVLPAFNVEKRSISLMKVDNLKTDLMKGNRGIMEPDLTQCKHVPVDVIDIAIIPGLAFDEKGGRLGSGEGYYDRFIPKLSATTRKVALAFENQIVQQVPMISHDKHVDIIITEERIIYKI